jgi:hypothetical protein
MMKFLLVNITFILLACSEPAFRVHEKLDERLQADLKVMVAEVMRASGDQHLMPEPYFEIKDLRFFTGDTAKIFSGYAEVDFHYYKDIGIIQKRKYRYDANRHYWDRYFKKLVYFSRSNDEIKSQTIIPKK